MSDVSIIQHFEDNAHIFGVAKDCILNRNFTKFTKSMKDREVLLNMLGDLRKLYKRYDKNGGVLDVQKIKMSEIDPSLALIAVFSVPLEDVPLLTEEDVPSISIYGYKSPDDKVFSLKFFNLLKEYRLEYIV